MAGLSHLDSAKGRLAIRWNAYDSKSQQRLDKARAIAELATDGWPILVLREGNENAKGGDKKLNDLVCRSFSNEKVQLASQWFRCVKVGDEVLKRNHPLSALFDGDKPPRVVLSSSDGSRVVQALATTWQKLDWQDVIQVLRADYRNSPTKHVKELQKVLVALDELDEKHKTVSRALQRAENKGSPTQGKRLRKQLRKIEKKYKATLAREKKYKELRPRVARKAKPKAKDDKVGSRF